MQTTTENSFWNFLRGPDALSQAAAAAADCGPSAEAAEAPLGAQGSPQQRENLIVVPQEASMHGGDPIFVLLPQCRRLRASSRYCVVYEGTNRRHLASCEVTLASKALFSRVPEHDSAESVELSVYEDSQLVASLRFAFTPDRLLSVATDIIDALPLVPPSLRELLSAAASSCCPLDVDRQLSAALRRSQRRRACNASCCCSPSDAATDSADTVFHCLAEAGWLESLAHLLRLTGQPESWLSLQRRGHSSETDVATVAELVRDRRFRSVLASPDRLHRWLDQLDGQASRACGQAEAVVAVKSWRTPAGAALIIMSTNKEKADTPLDQDLAIFPMLEACHREDHYLLKSPQGAEDPASMEDSHVRETACAQTEIGKSIEDLLDSDAPSAPAAAEDCQQQHREQFAETDTMSIGPTGEISMSHSMSQSVVFHHRRRDEEGATSAEPSVSAASQQQQQQKVSVSRSASTPTLYPEDFP